MRCFELKKEKNIQLSKYPTKSKNYIKNVLLFDGENITKLFRSGTTRYENINSYKVNTGSYKFNQNDSHDLN